MDHQADYTLGKYVIINLMKGWFKIPFLIFFAIQTACNAALPQAAPVEDGMEFSLSPTPGTPNFEPTLTLTPFPTSTFIPTGTPPPSFSFAVFGDSAYHNGAGEFDTAEFFRGAVESIAQTSDTAFIVGVGDLSPVEKTDWTMRQVFGNDLTWFPVVGNHDLWPADLNWIKAYHPLMKDRVPPSNLHPGPPSCEKTTYSFDHLNAHFVMLNVYCDADDEIRTDGAIVDALYDWLAEDLAGTSQEHIFVFGHEPAFPMPDKDLGIVRHLDDSLDKYPITRDRFWKLLKDRDVRAYITGHTHSFSAAKVEGVWQVDVGHAMGIGQQATPPTYVIFRVEGERAFYDAYRGRADGEYSLQDSADLR